MHSVLRASFVSCGDLGMLQLFVPDYSAVSEVEEDPVTTSRLQHKDAKLLRILTQLVLCSYPTQSEHKVT